MFGLHENLYQACSLLEISITCHLSIDLFLHCHGNQRSCLGGEGVLLLCQESNITEIETSYIPDMSKHWLGRCCLTIWKFWLFKKIMVCHGMSKVPVFQWVGTGFFPIYAQWRCVSATIPLMGYRAKTKQTLLEYFIVRCKTCFWLQVQAVCIVQG